MGAFFTSLTFVNLFMFSNTAYAKTEYLPPKLESPSPGRTGADPLLASSWYLDEIDVFRAWHLTKGRRQTVVAIVDSGVLYNHEEFADALARNERDCNFDGQDDDNNGLIDDCIGWNFSEEMSLPWDDNGHGSMLASIIAGAENNSEGSVGICPECSILPIRFLDKEGIGDDADAIRGIDYAVSRGVSVLSLSFAGEGYDQKLRNSLKRAADKDIVIVVAAGNDGDNNDVGDIYPANFHLKNMLTIAASTRKRELWLRSNFGYKNVQVAAPGTTIWGLWSDEKWYQSSGTSFATPIVAAVAGLIRSANPRLSAIETVEIIKSTVVFSDKIDHKIRTGGIVNAALAVECAVDPQLACLNKKK